MWNYYFPSQLKCIVGMDIQMTESDQTMSKSTVSVDGFCVFVVILIHFMIEIRNQKGF